MLFYFYRRILRFSGLLVIWSSALLILNQSMRIRLLFRIFQFFLILGKTVNFRKLVLTHTTIASSRLSITKISLFIGIRYRKGGFIVFPFDLEESLDDSDSHFMIILNFILCYPIVLDVSQKRTLHCKNVWDFQLAIQSLSSWVFTSSPKTTVSIAKP